MRYSHTQYGHWHWLLALVAAACGTGIWTARNEPWVAALLGGLTLLMALLALSFVSMTVSDDGDALAIRFGPLPLMSFLLPRIAYEEITEVEPDRTTLLDGWGIHWLPGRGTAINIWGYDCVRIKAGRRTYRIGTDDVDNLVAFLRTRVEQFQRPSR